MIKKTNFLIILLSLFFITFSFIPTIYEYLNKNKIPGDRYFLLEHNYNFDYNFYLSRVRQGIEGRWLVTEKYFNHPHKESLFQVIYLYLGKIGSIFGLSVPGIYHLSRFIFGFLLLAAIAGFGKQFFKEKQLLLFFLLAVTSGSWPILVRAGDFYRFATYMGWWSVIDSLQRLTIMPHILIGQSLFVLIITIFSNLSKLTWIKAFMWGIVGLIAGIIFPPALIIIYMYLFVISIFEILDILSLKIPFKERSKKLINFISQSAGKLLVFIFLTIPGLIYLQIAFRDQPWKALALFDIEHRFIMPYKDYALALGPVLILGLFGLVWAFLKSKKQFYSPVAWILAIVFLFLIFENVPQQSPLRFTEGLINVPLAVLATKLISNLWKIRKLKIWIGILTVGVILLGLSVMGSMILWLSDQAYSKRSGTWKVPLGAQHAYPIKDFMDAIFYLRDKTDIEDVVLGYITTGNYIPPYAGNYVYIGHANTPDEDEKEIIASNFFKGLMNTDEAKKWLNKERVSFIFFGPQEQELGNIGDLKDKYNFLNPVYINNQVVIYKII